jgi:hypothetical protein
MLLRLELARVRSIDPDECRLVKWLVELGVWDFELESRVRMAKGFIPVDMEYRIKDQLGLPLDKCSLKLFSELIKSDLGINLQSLGFINGDWRSPDTCVGKMTNLLVARVQDEKRFKALPIAFDPGAQHLLGFKPRLN